MYSYSKTLHVRNVSLIFCPALKFVYYLHPCESCVLVSNSYHIVNNIFTRDAFYNFLTHDLFALFKLFLTPKINYGHFRHTEIRIC